MATQLIAPESIDDSRFERIDGQWVERPVATTKHVRIQKRTLYLFTQLLEGSDGEVNQEWSITRPGHANENDPDYLTPDILVVYPPITEAKNGHLAVPGFLAVEILSPGQDLFWKAFLYAAWGTKHVWIINPETRLGFEFHGGPEFRMRRDVLQAEHLTLRLESILQGIA